MKVNSEKRSASDRRANIFWFTELPRMYRMRILLRAGAVNDDVGGGARGKRWRTDALRSNVIKNNIN
jgi:hypothetical protein